MKLPHTRNSAAGSNMYEPVVASQFAAYIFPAAGVTNDPLILQDHIRNVVGLFEDKTGDNVITQKFQTATRTYDSNDKGDTSYTFTITFTLNLNDANQNYVYKIIRDWARKKYNPLTGERGLKRDYVGTIVVQKHDRVGNIFHTRTAIQCFPNSNIPDLTNDYDNHEAQEIDIQFVADWVDETEL
ncbi:gp92 [Sphingomonas phage PAU]|uniref:gp92 n=1 Tax=Sphingomonas phage PAU TaxID=1150991 RepID=UPI00025731E6|nr:gp92 [Sphingomonas phage PAU]AFF28090.1 gp92 [Sphingomonas phage PAU]